jgi:hypothetical protein
LREHAARRYEMRVAAVVSIAVVLLSGTLSASQEQDIAVLYGSLEEALLDMGMTTDDLRIRYDYATPDAFRLPLVDSLMHSPKSLVVEMDELASKVEAGSSLYDCAATLWETMAVGATMPGAPDTMPEVKDLAGRLAHLPAPFREAVYRYVGSMDIMAGYRARALARVAPQIPFLRKNMPRLLAPDEEYEGIDPFELHRLEKAEEALSDSVLRILERIDVAAVASMSLEALGSAEETGGAVAGWARQTEGIARYRGRRIDFDGKPASVSGGVLYTGLTPWGPIVVGDTTRTAYEGCFALIIDPGGDDVYDLSDSDAIPFRLIVDAAGDDAYRAGTACGVAGAMMGTSVLVDMAGDDSYRSADMSLGAGICGIGAVDDREGNDSYISGVFSQAAGFLGLGILKDGAGNDTYVAGMQSQAFGYVMGSGLLWEAGGNDTYHTRMSQTDILRYDDHYLTLSQGCAFGSRPDYSGGIGLLLDSWGNDVYSSDIFGQGVAYWFAVGALIDRGGHDRYCSYQYAQGAGIHLAFGLLLDGGGDDGYLSKGVSQGCGHDLAFGILADLSGNDWYTATDLSQGAGSANGTGILYDADGNDAYSAKSEINVNGYGDYRREFGSIGLQLDRSGRDYYAARGEDCSLWEGSTYGLGEDVPGEAAKPAGDLVVKSLPLEVRDYTQEELFILCARGEPRFQEWRQYAFDRMVHDTLATLTYLSTILDTKDARERHTIKDILRRIGDPAVPMLTRAILGGTPSAQSEASWILGLIGSPQAFDPLLELSRAEGWQQRSSALNALAKLDDLSAEDLDRLEGRAGEVLSDTGEVFYVKKDAAYACGRQHLCGSLGLLINALDTNHQAVRFTAAEAVKDLAEFGCGKVADLLAANLPEMSEIGVAAGLYAARGLGPEAELDVAEGLIAARPVLTDHDEVALAGLLARIAPETERDRKRLDALMVKMPSDSWKVKALVKPESTGS